VKFCDLTLESPQENLACDEALLDLCDEGLAGELLRVWEPSQYFVVVGYANKAATEVNLAFCQRNTIPVLRRCTGGGSVLQGPGVLNYSLCLHVDPSGPLRSISSANDFILRRHLIAFAAALKAPIEARGQTDLAIGGLKFCGNAQRRKKHFLIFHGCFLLHLDFELMEKTLPMPSKQPAYRLNRSHPDFLMNLKVPPEMMKAILVKAWGATEAFAAIPFDRISGLTREKYARDEWNSKF
jgi:lipoate-protein ligase A